jgi:hypothetical protein
MNLFVSFRPGSGLAPRLRGSAWDLDWAEAVAGARGVRGSAKRLRVPLRCQPAGYAIHARVRWSFAASTWRVMDASTSIWKSNMPTSA